MKWSVADVRRRLKELLRDAVREPQPIYNHSRLVAVVIDPETYAEFQRWREQQGRPVSEAFGELRRLCLEEKYELELPLRADRPNALLGGDDEVPR